MNILGIGGYSHDSAAVLLQDGRVAAGVMEERLTRVKHQGGVPREAVRWCLDQAGITPDDVDHIGCYMRPGLRLLKRLPYRVGTAVRSPKYAAAYFGYELVHNARYLAGMRSLRGRNTRLHFMEHHPAHAAASFLVSPYDEAALLSIDYIGEWAVTWMGIGRGTEIRPLRVLSYPNSLGVFYSALTDYLGFRRASDEYKVMGLASYGEPAFLDTFRQILRPDPDGGTYRIDLSWMQCHYLPGSRLGYFSKKFLDAFGPKRTKSEPVQDHHANIAASAQAALEETVLGLAGWLQRETGAKHLCLGGGVALNCSMNGRLLRDAPYEGVYIQPAAGDDGIALGAALQLHHQLTDAPRGPVMEQAYFGPGYSNEEVRAFLDLAKIPYTAVDDPAEAATRLIADGAICGWFQGRMEWGPRALGSRSILADPTRPDMKDLINKYVKHREEFRPFAPSVLEDRAHEYFEGCAKSPFMLFVYPVKPEMREVLPAITHVDGTARVQTVNAEQNPLYHRLISAFDRLRGVPLVLNTSFNVMGEPIVNTPADAVRCFYSCGMDALVLGNCVVEKKR